MNVDTLQVVIVKLAKECADDAVVAGWCKASSFSTFFRKRLEGFNRTG
jgi:hypothetical protein